MTDDAYDEVVAAYVKKRKKKKKKKKKTKKKAFCVDRILDDCVRRVPS